MQNHRLTQHDFGGVNPQVDTQKMGLTFYRYTRTLARFTQNRFHRFRPLHALVLDEADQMLIWDL
jgi:hypothetical protein